MTTSAPRYLGVDPGKGGAIAVYTPVFDELRVWDVPTSIRLNKEGRKFRNVDIAALQAIAAEIGKVDVAVHEMVNARPGEAASYAFDFGLTTGLLRGAFQAHQTSLVSPAVWKPKMGCPADKDLARARASQVLPMHEGVWPLKKHDGRAEAALLAVYGFRYVKLP